MWARRYKDYPPGSFLVKEQVEPNKGIIGCEMHDLMGWGEEFHVYTEKQPGFFKRMWKRIFG